MELNMKFTDKELRLIQLGLWLGSIHGERDRDEMLNLYDKVRVIREMSKQMK